MPSSTPYFRFDAVRPQFGDRVDRYREFLYKTDPLADDAVAALATLPAGREGKLLKQALDAGIATVP